MHMKHFLPFLTLSLLAFSCTRTAEAPLVEWTFHAPSTKASLNASGAFSWTEGDQIDVWNEASGAFVTFTSGNGSGRFSAQAPASAHFTTAAFSPAGIADGLGSVTLPAAYSKDELAAGRGIPMYAPVNEGSDLLHFKHLGAYLTIAIDHLPGNIDKLILSSPTVSLNGNFTLVEAAGEKEIRAATGSGSLSLTFAPGANQSIRLTVPVPTGTYALSYQAYDGDTPEKFVRRTEDITFRRGHLYTLATADPVLEGEYLVLALTCEEYDIHVEDNLWE